MKIETQDKAEKIWQVTGEATPRHADVIKLASTLGILPLTAALLYNRGYRDAETAAAFLNCEDTVFHDPFLMADMDRAVERIARAIADGEKIVIYGDYDVDGVTAVSSLYLYLSSRGCHVTYYIPNRVGEGYGVNCGALDRIAKEGGSLVITVDNGITAHEEVLYAKTIGIDMVITDHHACRETVPEACAVVNPHRLDCQYPFKELAGVGVVFKLICALAMRFQPNEPQAVKEVCMHYADLAAIGTVADVMPLVGENRLIVSIGMRLLSGACRPGIAALLDMASAGGKSGQREPLRSRKINTSMIGFTIAPRLNAAGRISTADHAVELFLTENSEEAERLAEELCDMNRSRQEQENKIAEEAYQRIADKWDLERDPVIVLGDDSWHHGIVGIVASRITEHYHLPSILFSFEGEIGKGSGRSIKGLHLVEALSACGDLLVRYGGHELAAGLTIERSKFPEFCRRINAYARSRLRESDRTVTLALDLELEEGNLTLSQAEELSRLEPFGTANPTPLFLLRDARIEEITPIGKNKHTRFLLRRGNRTVTAIYFGAEAAKLPFRAGDTADFAVGLQVNEFMGERSVQCIVRDIRPGTAERVQRETQENLYRKACSQVDAEAVEEALIPTRDDFTRVYRYLCGVRRKSTGEVIHCTLFDIAAHFGSSDDVAAAMVRIRFVLEIFVETGLLLLEEPEPYRYEIRLCHVNGKVDLTHSAIYRKLTSDSRKKAD